MDVKGWRAWYSETLIYDSRTTNWVDLPDDGLLVVVVYLNTDEGSNTFRRGTKYRRTMSGHDHFFEAQGPLGPIYGSSNDSMDLITQRYGPSSIKKGQWSDDETYSRIRDLALASEDL